MKIFNILHNPDGKVKKFKNNEIDINNINVPKWFIEKIKDLVDDINISISIEKDKIIISGDAENIKSFWQTVYDNVEKWDTSLVNKEVTTNVVLDDFPI